MTRTVHLALTLALAVAWAAVTLALLGALGPDWHGFAPATCLGSHCFCEAPRWGSLVLQPANSWSSFGFVVVGAWIMLGAAQHPGSALGTGATLWFGLTAIIIGVGSVMLHATLTLWGQFADVVGMYLLGSFTLVRGVARWRRLQPITATAVYVILCAMLIALLWAVPETRRWLFAVILLFALAIEWWLARPRRIGVRPELLLLGVAANLLAFAIWILDQTRTWCVPESWLQGHAAWHLLGAIAVALSYGYYRSERPMATSPRVHARESL